VRCQRSDCSGGDDQEAALHVFGQDAVPDHPRGTRGDNVLELDHLPRMQIRTMVEGSEAAIAVIQERPTYLLMNGLVESEPDLSLGVVARFRSPVVVAHVEFIG
jgi:hypothetical protein